MTTNSAAMVLDRIEFINGVEYIDGICQEGRAGRWRYDEELGRVIKFSHKAQIAPRVGFKETYYDPGLDQVVSSAHEKRDLLKKNGLFIKEKGGKTRAQLNKEKRSARSKQLKTLVRAAKMESGGNLNGFVDNAKKILK